MSFGYVSIEGFSGHKPDDSDGDGQTKTLGTCWQASTNMDCGCLDNIGKKTKAMDETLSTKSACVCVCVARI